MPVLFVGHGSPMNAIEENEFVQGFRDIATSIPKPTAVLCVSAHWETMGTSVTAMDQPKTIHDFYGFPQELYNVEYPASGSPALAKKVVDIVKETGIRLDYEWGLDHGCWIVLKHFYPNGDVPIVELSLDHFRDAEFHYRLGRQLLPLRRRGVLIVGSGNMVHNLGLVDWDNVDTAGYGYDWALEASEKMKKHILNDEHEQLINYRLQGRAFDLAIPTPEHYLPLLYALALKEKDDEITLFNDKAVAGSLTMTSIKIGQ
jgi:4,5-DOPA dioxygenase extradiol